MLPDNLRTIVVVNICSTLPKPLPVIFPTDYPVTLESSRVLFRVLSDWRADKTARKNHGGEVAALEERWWNLPTYLLELMAA
jgi:hypothetical protein